MKQPRLTLLFFIGIAIAAEAQDLQIRSSIGFSGFYRSERWAPVFVSIENLGARFDGTVELVLSHEGSFAGGRERTVYGTEVQIGAGSIVDLQFVAPLSQGAGPLRVLARPRNAESEDIATHTVDLSRRLLDERVVFVLEERPSLDRLLAEINADRRRARFIYARRDRLPEHWLGLDSVDAVVIRRTPVDLLRGGFGEVLRTWVAAGGTLVVSGGPEPGPARRAALEDLFPLSPEPRSGAEASGEGRADSPRARERRFGRGRLIELDFDAADAADSDLEWLTDRMLEGRPDSALAPVVADRNPDRPARNLLRAPLYDFPPRWLVAVFAAALIAAAAAVRPLAQRSPLSRIGERSFGRARLAMPLLSAALGLFGSALAALVFEIFSPAPDLLVLDTRHLTGLGGTGMAIEQRETAVIAARRVPFELTIARNFHPLPDLEPRRGIAGQAGLRIIEGPAATWETQSAQSVSATRLDTRLLIRDESYVVYFGPASRESYLIEAAAIRDGERYLPVPIGEPESEVFRDGASAPSLASALGMDQSAPRVRALASAAGRERGEGLNELPYLLAVAEEREPDAHVAATEADTRLESFVLMTIPGIRSAGREEVR